jgi:perosamine synthetase
MNSARLETGIHQEIVAFIRQTFKSSDFIPLHEPRFIGSEKSYLAECIDSTYVSYVGQFVTRFEDRMREYTGARFAAAMASGTVALHIALLLAGVRRDDEVLTQSLTFVATPNAISYCGAQPVFLDSERRTLGMDPDILEEFLASETRLADDGFCYNIRSGRRVSACVPMHVFGHPVEIERIKNICAANRIFLIEDAAESLGSFYHGRHTGTFAKLAILSFNGNKTITTGGGGMLLCDDEALAKRAKHISTTARIPHSWEIAHDEVGYNYRMPNVNAAIGCAQMESLDRFVENKRELAALYRDFCERLGVQFLREPQGCRSNYWLNALILRDHEEREAFLKYSNGCGVMTRPLWKLMHKLDMYKHCQTSRMDTALWLEARTVNIPSSVRL